MSLISFLDSCNRKERYFLLGEALGNPHFALGARFRERLSRVLALGFSGRSWTAMDYHLDWIQASLLLHSGFDEQALHLNRGHVAGTQEDVDLIVAVESGATTVLVMIEAKAATGWTNAQLRSNAGRLRTIFGGHGENYPGVAPRYLLMSPREPKRIETSDWPVWMAPEGRPQWLELPFPVRRRLVTRTDADGRPSAAGASFRFRTSERTVLGSFDSSVGVR